MSSILCRFFAALVVLSSPVALTGSPPDGCCLPLSALALPASFTFLSASFTSASLQGFSVPLCTSLYSQRFYGVSRVALRLPAGSLASSLAVVALAGSQRLRTLRFDGALSHTWAFIMSLILKENSEDLYKSSIIYIKVLDSKRNPRIIHYIEFRNATELDSSFKSSEPVV